MSLFHFLVPKLQEGIDLIYEGITTNVFFCEFVNVTYSEGIDLIYEGITTFLRRDASLDTSSLPKELT